MLKGNKKYIFFLGACFTALILLQFFSPKPINWKLSYIKNAKIPFGTSALYSILPAIFPSGQITNGELPIYNMLNNINIQNHNYIIINNVFKPDTLDTRELLKFAARGNNVFIAANSFEGKFADSLKLKTDNFFNLGSGLESDSSSLLSITKYNDTIKTNFASPSLKNASVYKYTKGIEGTYLNSFDTARSIVLNHDADKKINFIEVKIGKGKVYINTLPEAFSNYHFVSANYSYVYKALSYMPSQPVIWDEYYKAGNNKSDSPLRVILDNPMLRTAYYVIILSIILFMIFGAKRLQRVIPVIEPYKNTTLQFVDIVGALYYQTGNHKNIADKKITFFLEYIRTAFQVKTTIYDDAFITRVTSLSGIEEQKIHDMFYYFSDIGIRPAVTQQELLKLNKMIEDFHKLSKR